MRLRSVKIGLVTILLSTVIAILWSQQLKMSPYGSFPVDDDSHSDGDFLQTQHAIVCMIFTTPNNWFTKGRAVQYTWAKRCPFPIFFYSGSNVSENHEIRQAKNTVALDVPEGRDWLTDKTLAGLRYSLDKFGNVAEWFMKADDDTYVIWENLEYLLDSYRRTNSTPSYFGRKVSNILQTGYASGGAGYLIRKHAVELIVHQGPKTAECLKNVAIEDTDIGRCLAHFKIYPTQTLDDFGRLKFHSDNPLNVLDEDPYFAKFYHINIFGKTFGNPNSNDEMLSHLAVTFHYVTPGQMLMFDYLLYYIHRGARPPSGFLPFRRPMWTHSQLSPSSATSWPPAASTDNVTQKTAANQTSEYASRVI